MQVAATPEEEPHVGNIKPTKRNPLRKRIAPEIRYPGYDSAFWCAGEAVAPIFLWELFDDLMPGPMLSGELDDIDPIVISVALDAVHGRIEDQYGATPGLKEFIRASRALLGDPQLEE